MQHADGRSGIGNFLLRPAAAAARRAGVPLLCAGLLLPAPAAGQPASPGVSAGAAVWRWQNPRPTGNMLLGVRFLDAANGWAIGAEGTCLKTADGGASWSSAGPRTNRWLHGISFPDALHGWVVGHDGAIFATADGGTTWTAQDAGADAPYLKGVDFVSASTGWAVGKDGAVLRTSDGGAHWVRQSLGALTSLEGVDFVSAATGWAVGEGGAIYHTNDGGATWLAQTSPLGGDLEDVSFSSASHGCAAGPPGIVCTGDAGQTWELRYEKSPGYIQFDYMHGIQMLEDGNGWAAAEDGVRRSIDGGLTWGEAQGSSGNGLLAIHVADGSVWAVGEDGAIHTTANGGNDWTQLHADAAWDAYLTAVDFLADGDTGWAVGYAGAILHSVDGGDSWVSQDTLIPSGYLHAVDAISATQAWAVGDGGVILYTASGGEDPDGAGALSGWTQRTYSATEWHALNDVDFLEDGTTRGWAVGDAGTILSTVNGTDWLEQASGTTGDLSSVSFVDEYYGWATGQGGVFRTTTGGVDPDGDGAQTGWVATGGPSANAIHFIDRQRGWAVGNAGGIFHTADGGATWTPQQWLNPGYAYPDFKDVWFADELHGWIVGVPFGNLLLRTIDGGATWDLQSSGCSQTLEGVVFAGLGRGWAVGWGGTILRYDGPLETDPPATTASGFAPWNSRAVTVRLAPGDAGTGPAWTWVRTDAGALRTGRSAFVGVDPDYHSTDGLHRVEFFSSDNAGNREAQQAVTFGIDTQRPWTKVLLPIGVTRGATATIRYRVNDPLPNGRTATATILIRNARRALAKRIVVRGARTNANLQTRFVCRLPRGVYTVKVAATDAAGNAQYYSRGQSLTVR